MSTQRHPRLDQSVSEQFVELASAAKNLNKASDELGNAIQAIDSALQRLNLGVPTWVTIQGGEDPYTGNYWSRDLGYARVGKKWGIALCTREGNYNNPDEENVEQWLFSDAPRWLRVDGIMRIPDLLQELVKQANETTSKIKSKTTEANQLAEMIAQAEKLMRQSK